jgi:hypothetical protein
MPSKEAHTVWRREIEAIHAAMDELLSAARRSAPEERPVREMQFAALVERRAAADRAFLDAARTLPSYLNKGPALAPDIFDQDLEPAEPLF